MRVTCKRTSLFISFPNFTKTIVFSLKGQTVGTGVFIDLLNNCCLCLKEVWCSVVPSNVSYPTSSNCVEKHWEARYNIHTVAKDMIHPVPWMISVSKLNTGDVRDTHHASRWQYFKSQDTSCVIAIPVANVASPLGRRGFPVMLWLFCPFIIHSVYSFLMVAFSAWHILGQYPLPFLEKTLMQSSTSCNEYKQC